MNYISMRWLLLAIFVISLSLQFFLCKLYSGKPKKYVLIYPSLLLTLVLWSIVSLINPALPYPDIVRQVGFFDLPDSAYGLLFTGLAFTGAAIGSVVWKFINWWGCK